MINQLSIESTLCSEYQTLLEECQSALEIWNEHRAQVLRSHLIEREAGDELLRLQAKYARAYAVLQKHVRICLRCRSVSRIPESDYERNSETLPDNTLYI